MDAKNDERVSLEGLEPREALKALLAVDPDSESTDPRERAADEQAKTDERERKASND